MIDIDVSMLAYDINADNFIEKISNDIPAFKHFKGKPETRLYTSDEKLNVFQWVVLMFDFNSPTRKIIKEFYFRKVYCANLVGLEINKEEGKFDEWVESFLIGLNEDVNKLQAAYIASFSSPEYTQLCGFLAMQYQVMMEIIRGVSDEKTSKNLTFITTHITELTRELFGSGVVEEIQQARKALYSQAGEDLRKLRPEAIVEMLEKEGGLPDSWNPYGDYIPEKMTFAGDDHSIEDDE
jgi:hypothetical protein